MNMKIMVSINTIEDKVLPNQGILPRLRKFDIDELGDIENVIVWLRDEVEFLNILRKEIINVRRNETNRD
jgi:hypothetical protein